jgi:putative flavoprotein involved in K+ transport
MNRTSTTDGTDTAATPAEQLDVLVIGAGQAGLAIGHYLARSRRRFVIVDGADAVGSAWRSRWDSLTLFTPRRYDGLPGLAFPGDPDGYPTRDEVVAYLEAYAQTFDLPIELNATVRRLTTDGDRFAVELDAGTVAADQVVVATGPFQVPHVPAVAGELSAGVQQLHSTGYRRTDDVQGDAVLVVGGGNTGYQIAKELAATRSVHLAVSARQKPLPQRILGRDLFWWLTKLGLLKKTRDSRLGRRLRERDTLIGSTPRELRRRGIAAHPRVTGASDTTVEFGDGSRLDVDAVVWATGYRPDYSWLALPVLDDDGRVRHRRGVSAVPGLYFLGLSWQHTRGSALLGWIEDDAEFISREIDRFARGANQGAIGDDTREGALPQTAPLSKGA